MQRTKKNGKLIAVLLVLALVMAFIPAGAFATGDYELITVYSGGALELTWNGNSGTLAATNTFVPDQFTLFVEGTNSVTTSTGIVIDDTYIEYSNDPLNPNDVNTVYIINTSSLTATTGTLTISVTQSNHGGTGTFTISVPKPVGSITGGAYPEAVVSFLPIGQFATGGGWGSADGKFTTSTTAYCTTGISLGAFGGYVEFDFGEGKGISENSKNPYGVDFVVYGNSFHNNPEAGAVQVSVDGTEWYELAGSHYYDGGFNYIGNQAGNNKFSAAYTGVLQNADVIYKIDSGLIKATLKDENGSAKFTDATFCNNTNWWPTGDEYPDSVIIAAHKDSNVTIARTGSSTGDTLTYGGVTAVPDSNDISYYAFGYADVIPNGNPSVKGTAINPYTPYTTNNSKTGGDGFDLSWAVDIDSGEPVSVTGKVFRYVRVYTAVLDNGTFGETSTEVCGIFATANAASGNVGITDAPTITIGTETIDLTDSDATPLSGNVILYNYGLVTGSSIVVSGVSSGANVYINSTYGTTYTTTSSGMVRIIVQNGTAAPFIVVIK